MYKPCYAFNLLVKIQVILSRLRVFEILELLECIGGPLEVWFERKEERIEPQRTRNHQIEEEKPRPRAER